MIMRGKYRAPLRVNGESVHLEHSCGVTSAAAANRAEYWAAVNEETSKKGWVVPSVTHARVRSLSEIRQAVQRKAMNRAAQRGAQVQTSTMLKAEKKAFVQSERIKAFAKREGISLKEVEEMIKAYREFRAKHPYISNLTSSELYTFLTTNLPREFSFPAERTRGFISWVRAIRKEQEEKEAFAKREGISLAEVEYRLSVYRKFRAKHPNISNLKYRGLYAFLTTDLPGEFKFLPAERTYRFISWIMAIRQRHPEIEIGA
jgi:DNA-binding transcriptional MerR regulator